MLNLVNYKERHLFAITLKNKSSKGFQSNAVEEPFQFPGEPFSDDYKNLSVKNCLII